MEPQKKIKINRKPLVNPKSDKNKQDSLKIVENTLKKLENRYKQYGFNDSKEEEFLETNRNKEVVLELKSKEVTGKLVSIDKYRIGIQQEDKLIYYYKHAVIGYYAK